MFELETNISQWREDLLQRQTYQQQDLCELEDHLRESIKQLTAKGLSAEEGFFVACRRLGDTQVLSQEFAKVNAGTVFRTRLLWMCSGLLAYYLSHYIAAGLSGGVTWAAAFLGLRGTELGLLSTLAHSIFLVTGLCIVARQVKRSSSESTIPRSLRPGKLLVLLGASFFFAFATSFLWAPLLVHLLSAEEYSAYARAGAFGRIFGVLIPVLFMIILVTRMNPTRETK